MRTQTVIGEAEGAPTPWLELVAEQVSKLRFGIVQITVHDARVVQIERTEKVRLNAHSQAGTQQT